MGLRSFCISFCHDGKYGLFLLKHTVLYDIRLWDPIRLKQATVSDVLSFSPNDVPGNSCDLQLRALLIIRGFQKVQNERQVKIKGSKIINWETGPRPKLPRPSQLPSFVRAYVFAVLFFASTISSHWSHVQRIFIPSLAGFRSRRKLFFCDMHLEALSWICECAQSFFET